MSFKSIHGRADYFYPHPSIVRQSFKGEKLTPLAQQYLEEKARADTAQAQADLNAQRARQAEVRAEMAEAKVERLQTENAQLDANAAYEALKASIK